MKMIFSYLFLVLFFSCRESEIPEIYESQTFCIYWSEFNYENFETPAIVYRLKGSLDKAYFTDYQYILKNAMDQTVYPLNLSKKTKITDDGDIIYGLSLESKLLHDSYEKYPDDYNSCYSDVLLDLCKSHIVYAIDHLDTVRITLTLDHQIIEGLK